MIPTTGKSATAIAVPRISAACAKLCAMGAKQLTKNE